MRKRHNLLNRHLAKLLVPRLLLVHTRLLHPLADPLAHFALDDEIGCVSVVVHPLELRSELPRLCEHLLVLRVPFCYIAVHRVGEVKGKGDAIVVDAAVENDYAGLFAFAKAVDSEGLDIDGGNLNVVNVGEDGELDGAAPGVLFHEVGAILLWGGAQDGSGVFFWVGEDVLGDLGAKARGWVVDGEGASYCGEHAAVVVGHYS